MSEVSTLEPIRFCGIEVTAAQMTLIDTVVKRHRGLSRMELAHTLCELLDWRRANGGLKARECREFLERLADLTLPEKQRTKPVGSKTRVVRTARGEPGEPLQGALSDFVLPQVTRVTQPDERALWRELVGRYHYQGHAVPFGAHLRYFVHLALPRPQLVGCLQFSSAAWRLRARDQWIGWSDECRGRQLQRIVNNSRFLLLPWVQVRYLASAVLAAAARRIGKDWLATYGIEPLLLETLVELSRFQGTCYRAANWLVLGETSGRGRMDRAHQRHGASPKTVLVYPLVRHAQARLLAP